MAGGKKTYYRFYKDEEQEVWKDKTQSQITRTDLTTNMRLGNSPCKYYSEDGDSEGWRVPNQRELQMLIRAEKTGNKTGVFMDKLCFYGESCLYVL